MRTERAAQVTTRDTQRLRLIRQRFSRAPAACDACGGGHTQALSLPEAAAFVRGDVALVGALVAAGRLHQTQAADGTALICLDSLLRDGHGADDAVPETRAP